MYQKVKNVKVLITITCLRYKVTKSFAQLYALMYYSDLNHRIVLLLILSYLCAMYNITKFTKYGKSKVSLFTYA